MGGMNGRRRGVAALAGASLLAGCGATPSARAGGEAAPEEPPELVIFVYDRSTSIPDHSLAMAGELTRGRLRDLDHGDRISAMQVLQLSLAEPPARWSQQVPLRRWTDRDVAADSVSRVRFVRDAADYLRRYAEPAGRENINGTDLLSTFHDVGEEIRAHPGYRFTMYVFSDMLQSNRTIDMEGLRRMPSPGWVQESAARGTLPDLSGLCVVVVGARVDTEAGQAVKRFWEEYLAATGARLEDRNYGLRPVTLPDRPCSA